MPTPEGPGVLPEQFDGQFTLGPERLGAAGGAGLKGQLRLAEVQPPGDGEEPGGLSGGFQLGPEVYPVMSPDRGGPIGAAGGVLVERAGAPDVLAATVDLGVIDGGDVVAVPDPAWGLLDQSGQRAGDVVGPPGAGLGEGSCLFSLGLV